jgi:hypothetical protein
LKSFYREDTPKHPDDVPAFHLGLGWPVWEVSWHCMDQGGDNESRVIEKVEIRVELKNGETLDLPTFQKQCNAGLMDQQVSQRTCITSWSLPLRVCKADYRPDLSLLSNQNDVEDLWETRVKQDLEGELGF